MQWEVVNQRIKSGFLFSEAYNSLETATVRSMQMTVYYEAMEGVVESCNMAMAEIARTRGKGMEERIRAIWEPVANALAQSVRDDLGPAEVALAESLGSDFVGQTSDTGRIVSWGRDFGVWREFVIR